MNLLSECLPGDGSADDSGYLKPQRRGTDAHNAGLAEASEFADGAVLYQDGQSRKVINVSFNDYNLEMSNE